MTQFDSKLIAQAKKTKGYLLNKSNGLFSNWKRKYFLVLEDSLCLFEDETLESLKKKINFSQIINILALNTSQIQIKTKKKIYYLKASNPQDQQLWIASLNILKENYIQNIKNPKKLSSSSQSKQKPNTQPVKIISSINEKSKTNISPKKDTQNQKVTFLLRQKELSRFLALLQLQKLLNVTKEQKYLSRILFIEDKKSGIYFLLSSKSIYPVIDGDLVKEDFIYPYQLNVLYFLSLEIYKNSLQNREKTVKLIQVCKSSQILECFAINQGSIKLQIHCQKPVEIQAKHLSQIYVKGLVQCVKKSMEIGKQYWNPNGKLLKNIDEFVNKFIESGENELIFYKMVQMQFENSLNTLSKDYENKKQAEVFFLKIQNLTYTVTTFIEAFQLKKPVLNQIKQKFVKLFHKFTYNFMNQTWNSIYRQLTDQDLIIYAKKVFVYNQAINDVCHDSRVKQGSKTLLKLALKNFQSTINQLINNFSNVEEESLRILKKIQFEDKDHEIVCDSIFFNTFCNNFFSILYMQFKCLTEIPKSQQFANITWINMRQIFKTVLENLSMLAQNAKQRSTLISISNSLKFLKNKRIPQMFLQLQKSYFFAFKRQKEEFLKEVHYEIHLVQTFCMKKLFIITFSTIDKELLKHQIKNMDFQKICSIVNQEIYRLQYILPQVRTAMYEAAFQEVCFFFYICVVKYDNKLLNKDQCLSMLNQKMMIINQSFCTNVDQQKIILLLKDLNLLKQFITCPINNIKIVTRDLKKVFGSSFTQLNLKNLISLRVSSLKQRQCLFEECRQEIKSSYNSTEEIESFQRQSFFNSSYRQQRKSTLTQSLQSYCEHFDKVDKGDKIKPKTQRIMLFGFSNTLKEAYLYRKKIIKNINTSYNKLYFRLRKGQLLEYDNDQSQDVINCYLLNQLKKCYLEPEKNDCIHLQFEKQLLKLKVGNPQQSNLWIQHILEAMQQQKNNLNEQNQQQDQQGGLFQDLSKKVTFQTKQTNQASSPADRHKKSKKPIFQASQTQQRKLTPKKQPNANNVSPLMNKKNILPSKLNNAYKIMEASKKNQSPKKSQTQKRKEPKGCGTGCNFF